MSSGVPAVYLHVVDSVVGKMRDAFITENGDDSALVELQGTPLQTPVPTPLPLEPGQYQHSPDAATDIKPRRPVPQMQPSPSVNQRPLGVDVNVAYEEMRREEGGISGPQAPVKDFLTMPAGKRKREEYPSHFFPNEHIPQQDGSGDASFKDCFHQKVLRANNSSNYPNPKTFHGSLEVQERRKDDSLISSISKMKECTPIIPQCDGFNDGYDDVLRTEDYNTPSSYDALPGNDVGTPKLPNNEFIEEDEPPLNEDDDELDDLEQANEEPSINDLVLAQFEKVSRTKSKWKCVLRDGMMRLNDKDILFTKANGEFDF
ncbi:uncharacterized protein LOC131150724 isoform X11 [Malania oleifera]|uniref:uncharacterized protein LOC131150724 isoform X11 n=1 Tax=Malania oleifera TaxID=397392 RepID=UPI0025AE6572|nr:uncharacterized protein LOC131150724 isoform X11 [Malania oleifera]XP_057957617.1 uncharacterized protein LOC131150724 isoform X11 [Malania oleifera]XP_057957618.1 uncharacterized protein LOC131150724 isoform X11 [Malania oleifera]